MTNKIINKQKTRALKFKAKVFIEKHSEQGDLFGTLATIIEPPINLPLAVEILKQLQDIRDKAKFGIGLHHFAEFKTIPKSDRIKGMTKKHQINFYKKSLGIK